MDWIMSRAEEIVVLASIVTIGGVVCGVCWRFFARLVKRRKEKREQRESDPSYCKKMVKKFAESNPKKTEKWFGLLRKANPNLKAKNAAVFIKNEKVAELRSKGHQHHARAEYDEAIAAFSEAIDLDPENQNLYIDRGWCYKAAGQPELAAADDKKIKELRAAQRGW